MKLSEKKWRCEEIHTQLFGVALIKTKRFWFVCRRVAKCRTEEPILFLIISIFFSLLFILDYFSVFFCNSLKDLMDFGKFLIIRNHWLNTFGQLHCLKANIWMSKTFTKKSLVWSKIYSQQKIYYEQIFNKIITSHRIIKLTVQ